jgi:tetratricopeptide (TPR) repeat protein
MPYQGTSAPEHSFRWDFVTDPPTKLLAQLETARARFRRGQYSEAASAARRLLRHVDAKLPSGLSQADRPGRLAVIHADGRAVLALALHRLGSRDASSAVARCVDGYHELVAAGLDLRPPSLADYGMVLAVSGRLIEAVEPLVRAAEAGERVVQDLVRDTARRLLKEGGVGDALRLLRALHERYPDDPRVARDLATAYEATSDGAAAADAHVAAGALYADVGHHDVALAHFERAVAIVPAHPLAALGRCQTLLVTGRLQPALTALDELARTQPDLAGTSAVRALALSQADRADEALATIDEALARFRDDPWLLDTRVRLLWRQGRSADALSMVDYALGVDPTDRTWRSLRAQLMLDRGENVDQAVQTLRELAVSAPDIPQVAVQLASALVGLGQPGDALDVVIRALTDHPDEPALVATEVRLLAELGRHREAVRHAEEALRRGLPEQHLDLPLAEAQLGAGDVMAALRTTESAVAVMPGSAAVHRLRGLVLREASDTSASVEELQRAWDMGARDDRTRHALAVGLVRLAEDSSDRDRSRIWLERALELQPGDVTARHLMADVLREEGDYAAALMHAELGLQVDPDNALLLTSRGLVQDLLGHSDLAEQDFRRAVERDQTLGSAHAELGELLRTTGRSREALEHFSLAVRAAPRNAWILASKGATEYSLDMYDEALASLGQALESNGEYAWAHGVRAMVLADLARFSQAQADVERALTIQPSMDWCWVLAGWLALHEDGAAAMGSAAADRAERAFRRALEANPEEGSALAGLGEALAIQAHDREAQATFERAVEVLEREDSTDASGYAARGWCLLRLKDYDEAIDAFLTASSLDPELIAASFDLALALLCKGESDVGLEEFAQAASRVTSIRHEGRRRGVLHEAARDLEALASGPLRTLAREVDAALGILDRLRSSDARVRAGDVQVPTA